MDLIEALNSLDPANEEHWTSDGSPSLQALQTAMGSDKAPKRADVTAAAPLFKRDNRVLPEMATGAPAVQPTVDGDAAAGQDEPPAEAEALVETEEERALREAQAILAEAQEREAAARRVVAEAQAKVDAALEQLPEKTQHDNQLEIMRFLESQAAQREARVARHMAVREMGLSAADMRGKAPIDAALARNTQRGAARPVVPLKTE